MSGKTVSVQSLVPTVVIGVPVKALGQFTSKSHPVLPHNPTISTKTVVKELSILGITKVHQSGAPADKLTSVPVPVTTGVHSQTTEVMRFLFLDILYPYYLD